MMWKWIKKLLGLSNPERQVEIEAKVVSAPKLQRVLDLIAGAVLQQATQPGGPDQNKTREMTIDCSDDEILRTVLEIKGGQLGILIKLRASASSDDPDEAFKQRMAEARALAGINQADLPMGVP
jgi:hypothetical protein